MHSPLDDTHMHLQVVLVLRQVLRLERSTTDCSSRQLSSWHAARWFGLCYVGVTVQQPWVPFVST